MDRSADTTTPDAGNATRRSLLVGAIRAIWAAITGALAAPTSVYLLRRPKPRANDEWIEVGDISALPAGRPVEMFFQRNRGDGWKIASEKLTAWVVKTQNNGLLVFGPRCTHLGCAHHWEEATKQFVCPCHKSLFSIEGKVLAGPAARPLDRYDVKLKGNKLLVGTLRRGPERMS